MIIYMIYLLYVYLPGTPFVRRLSQEEVTVVGYPQGG